MEFALLLPIIVLIILLVIDAGRFFFVANHLNMSSQEAARAESLGLSGQVTSISNSVMGTALNVASRTGSAAALVVSATPCGGSPKLATVQLSLTFQWLTPVNSLFFGGPGATSRLITAKGVRLCPG